MIREEASYDSWCAYDVLHFGARRDARVLPRRPWFSSDRHRRRLAHLSDSRSRPRLSPGGRTRRRSIWHPRYLFLLRRHQGHGSGAARTRRPVRGRGGGSRVWLRHALQSPWKLLSAALPAEIRQGVSRLRLPDPARSRPNLGPTVVV